MRYFVAVAEERSFSRAAERLHISQPPLSQQIKALEEELNAPLFHRLPRGVSLTAAGAALLKSSRAILANVRLAAQETTQIAAGMLGTVRMGTVSSALAHLVPYILTQVKRSMPGSKVELTEMSSREQTLAVLRDELDIGLVHTPIDTADLRTRQILREPFYAAVPSQHPLASREAVPVAELANEEFVFFPRTLASGLFDKMVSLCMNAGFSPKIHHTARHQSTMLQMVAMGLGVTIVPRSLQRIYKGSAVFLPLTGTPHYLELSLIWRESTANGLVERLIGGLEPLRDFDSLP